MLDGDGDSLVLVEALGVGNVDRDEGEVGLWPEARHEDDLVVATAAGDEQHGEQCAREHPGGGGRAAGASRGGSRERPHGGSLPQPLAPVGRRAGGVSRRADARVGRLADDPSFAGGDDAPMGTATPPRTDARVLVADASDAVGEALARLLRREPGVADVIHAVDAAETLQHAAELRPHLVLLDFALPEIALVAYLEQLRRAAPGTRVLLLLVHPGDAGDADDAPGVAGWLLKDAGAAELRHRVRSYLERSPADGAHAESPRRP